ncbi:MAG TPA: glycogen debranching protein GlgX [Vicinamibacterales bacterium]|nr:glycogen debranching protein GlgX [Vicinamibacterales bacterium]
MTPRLRGDGSSASATETARMHGRSAGTVRANATLATDVARGASAPLGATVYPAGVNFSVFSRSAALVELLLFDDKASPQPSQIIPLDPRQHRSYHYWHVFVPGLKAGHVYAYRAHGPFAPDRGYRYDREKVLLDPYGLAVAVPDGYDRSAARRPGDNTAVAMKSVVADPSRYDWEGDTPLRRPFSETVVYEMHVGGFTHHPSSGVPAEKRGTYAGLIQKIPYLADLGITAVELLPIFHFDVQDAPTGVNYWGYQPVSFFAPHAAYSSRRDPLGALDEFRDMVKALHRAGIEVILDVVFNHTTEGGHDGPTMCYRGLANEFYYILQDDKSCYADYSGCGNTLNANQPIVRRLIQDSLRYWVTEMHVDGFRFDLAAILSRDERGHPLPNPPVLWDIESDPLLAGTKLIAEAWDAAGLYQVGTFVGDTWQEWNGRFRDDVRRFLKGDNYSVSGVASRLLGSPDIYGHDEREAEQSVNFVTCHDGFTLNDLVSYNQKHNEANGDQNRDGANDNFSWNCGVEGPTDDPAIEALRNRQVKNFIALNMLAAGTPMLLMGDEVRRTQNGNNNAYCHDNDISWFDWRLLEKHADVHRFVKELVWFRQRRDVVAAERTSTLNQVLEQAKIQWHGVKLDCPDWSDHSHTLAFTLQSVSGRFLLHGILNAYSEPLTFELPPVPDHGAQAWRRCIDTALPSPDDVQQYRNAPVVGGTSYLAQARSVVLLARAVL